MEPDTRRSLYGVILAASTIGSTFLFLGWPWERAATTAAAPYGRRHYYHHGWYYRRYGGGHGGWIGRGFGWGTFGGFDNGSDGFRGGGPGFGK